MAYHFNPPIDPVTPKPMPRWEYATIEEQLFDRERFLKNINDYGKAGWKIVTIIATESHLIAYLEQQSNP